MPPPKKNQVVETFKDVIYNPSQQYFIDVLSWYVDHFKQTFNMKCTMKLYDKLGKLYLKYINYFNGMYYYNLETLIDTYIHNRDTSYMLKSINKYVKPPIDNDILKTSIDPIQMLVNEYINCLNIKDNITGKQIAEFNKSIVRTCFMFVYHPH